MIMLWCRRRNGLNEAQYAYSWQSMSKDPVLHWFDSLPPEFILGYPIHSHKVDGRNTPRSSHQPFHPLFTPSSSPFSTSLNNTRHFTVIPFRRGLILMFTVDKNIFFGFSHQEQQQQLQENSNNNNHKTIGIGNKGTTTSAATTDTITTTNFLLFRSNRTSTSLSSYGFIRREFSMLALCDSKDYYGTYYPVDEQHCNPWRAGVGISWISQNQLIIVTLYALRQA